MWLILRSQCWWLQFQQSWFWKVEVHTYFQLYSIAGQFCVRFCTNISLWSWYYIRLQKIIRQFSHQILTIALLVFSCNLFKYSPAGYSCLFDGCFYCLLLDRVSVCFALNVSVSKLLILVWVCVCALSVSVSVSVCADQF